MARARKNAQAAQPEAETATTAGEGAAPPVAEAPVDTTPLPAQGRPAEPDGTADESAALTSSATRSEPNEDARKPITTPDPRPIMSMSLGDTKGSPRMQLLRSHHFKQMQIRFDQQPDERYLAMLAKAGWKDRTEEEGIWTKQVQPGMWQPVADAERLFKEIGNAIRKEKGLESVMEFVA